MKRGRGKEKVTLSRDAFHIYLTVAMLVGIYIPHLYVWLAR